MKAIYHPADPVEAEILKSYLAAHGIACSIFGAGLWGGRGELPASPDMRLMLHDLRDQTRAEELLRQYERRRHAHGAWHCSCGETSPVTFESCWQCGSDRPSS